MVTTQTSQRFELSKQGLFSGLNRRVPLVYKMIFGTIVPELDTVILDL